MCARKQWDKVAMSDGTPRYTGHGLTRKKRCHELIRNDCKGNTGTSSFTLHSMWYLLMFRLSIPLTRTLNQDRLFSSFDLGDETFQDVLYISGVNWSRKPGYCSSRLNLYDVEGKIRNVRTHVSVVSLQCLTLEEFQTCLVWSFVWLPHTIPVSDTESIVKSRIIIFPICVSSERTKHRSYRGCWKKKFKSVCVKRPPPTYYNALT